MKAELVRLMDVLATIFSGMVCCCVERLDGLVKSVSTHRNVAIALALASHLAGALLHAVVDADGLVLLRRILQPTACPGLCQTEGSAPGHRPAGAARLLLELLTSIQAGSRVSTTDASGMMSWLGLKD